MNYYTIRVILIIGLIIIIYKIIKNKDIKHSTLLGVLIYLLFNIVFYIAPESLFLKFKSLENAFNYSYPGDDAILLTEIDNHGFVVYGDNVYKDIVIFNKKNNKFVFHKDFYSEHYRHITGFADFRVSYRQEKGTNNYFIYLESRKKYNKPVKIIDSLNNEFVEYEYDNKINYYQYIQDVSDDYYIQVNDVKVEINFENLKKL